MPMDGLTLGFIARELKDALMDGRVEKVSQPEKDMLLLLIRAQGKNQKVLLSAAPSFPRAHLTKQNYANPPEAPMFCMLLRKHLTGGRITQLEQLNGDRILRIVIESKDELGISAPRELYLELMGRHSNLTLVMNGRIVDAIRHVTDDMSRVRQALPGLLFTLPPAQDKMNPWQSEVQELTARLMQQTGRFDKVLSAAVSGLSSVAAQEIALRIAGRQLTQLDELDIPQCAQRLHAFFEQLPDMTSPVILVDETEASKDVFAFPYFSFESASHRAYPSLSEALDAYYAGRDRQDRMQQKGAALRKMLKTHIERDEKKLAQYDEDLAAGAQMEEYRIAGELLTAQLYLVPRGQAEVSLQNFYDENGGSITIALDIALTPAQNAQRYFKRYRKARTAQQLATEQKAKTLAELDILESALDDLGKCETEDDLNDIRRILQDAGILKRVTDKKAPKRPAESAPYRFVSSDGFQLSVGKNSVQNERLTQSAQGSDLWLHAKDMPGSHVIIHTQGQSVPDSTLLEAAQLAAYYSKGHGISVPVDYTYKKHVKKPGGTPTGFVTYTEQKTLIITCQEADVRRLKEGER